MATYCIGDIHGCFVEFLKLLEKLKFDPQHDHLVLTGDLIGRGPQSPETLKYIMHLARVDHCLEAVLGNHDLNFIAVWYGLNKNRNSYNLSALLKDPKAPEFVEYLCSLPLLYINKEQKFAVSHAGIYPAWGLHEAQNYADEVANVLANPQQRQLFLRNMYGDEPRRFSEDLSDLLRWRFTVNTFTRMRLCDKDLNLDFAHRSLSPQQALGKAIFPWFNYGHPSRFDGEQYALYFGHWSALSGQCYRPHIYALDTGCVWGNTLTAVCVETGAVFAVKSKQKPAFGNKKKAK